MKWGLTSIVDRLVGSTYPCGDTDIDELRLESLEIKAELLNELVDEFIGVMEFRHRPEGSINAITSEAASTLADVRDKVDDLIARMKEEDKHGSS